MATGAAAVAAVIANAIKASGILVRVEPEDFMRIVSRIEKPLIVYSEGGIFTTKYEYLTGYKGLAFYSKARQPLPLPAPAEIVRVKKIWIPA